MRRLASWFACAVVALFGPQGAEGQVATQARARDCDLQLIGVKVQGVGTTHIQNSNTAAGNSNTFAGGGVDGRCANSDQRILADSAESFGDDRIVYLIGRVRYSEKRMQLDADRMTYFMAEERLAAEGNVVGRTSTGTRFSGPRAVYLRAKPGLRERSRLDAGGRPDTWISASDAGTTESKADSTHVLADSIISDNDSLIYARGKVVLERPDFIATGDSAMLDHGRELAALRKSPKVTGQGERKFTLTGAEIDIHSRQRQAERVRSAGAARAIGEEVALDADTIDLRIADQKLSRATAWGPGRAHAVQSGRDITADSIDVLMPGQVLHAIHAVRRARAESLADSTRIRSKQRDWFAGDTINVVFDTLAARDTSKKAGIQRLVASGSAKSFQQAARDGVAAPDSIPAINYMTGRIITVEFAPDRTLDIVRVVDQVTGVLVQPVPADTTRKPVAQPIRPPQRRSRGATR